MPALPPAQALTVGNKDGMIVSSVRITDASEPMLLMAYGDDPTTKRVEGFVAGDKMELSLVDAETLEITTLIPEFDTEIGLENVYTDWGISKITSFKEGLGIFESLIETSLTISPNPVYNEARISWVMPKANSVQLDVLDCTGKVVLAVSDQNIDAGTSDMLLNTSDLNPGIYFLRLKSFENTIISKMVVLK
jgi:hypothetical protein